jgi:hypothetical protein
MTTFNPIARATLTAGLLACAAAPACEDRGPPDDVPYTRTGGIARPPTVGVNSNVGTGAASAAGAGGEAQGAGADGNPDVPGVGAGGSAGIPGIDDAQGRAGIPGVDDAQGSAGIPGIDEAAGSAGIPGADTGDDADAAGAGGSLGIGPSVGRVGTNSPPVASITASPQCISDLQTQVTLASSSVDQDGDSLSCSWAMPGAIPTTSEDCAVTVTFSDPSESPVVLFVDDGERVDSAELTIEPCPPLVPQQPGFP